ncbi:FtsW/RodA/SpoVE family cell cycle protein [Rossellomorea marisflavi]|uniref:FtsW/RodA/SpoVE family cell cycle protein n=1 Tax=Rossellomorea marisflavi TaxID=189381 RepID=UPI003D2EC9C9
MDNQKQSFFDLNLAFFILLIMITSILTLHSAETQHPENFMLKQAMWFGVSIVVVAGIFLFDFDQIKSLAPVAYGFGLLILVALLLSPESLVPEINGAPSWFVLPGIGSIQPSEYMKIFLILMLSYMTQTHNTSHVPGHLPSDFLYLGKVALISGIPMLLVLKQNDFGTTLVILVISAFIVFVSGINWKILLSLITAALLGIASLVLMFIYRTEWLETFVSGYQINRIYAWLDPFKYGSDISYQLKQSILAVGSGQTQGKGYDHGVVYIPEAHSDFIFSNVAEEFGFIGSSVVVCLYFLIIYRIVMIGIDQQKDTFQSYVCCGVAGLLAFHVFQNIGMVIGLLPITGIPLPLMSYGGSSVLATMMGLGLIMNMSLKRKGYMFSESTV